MRHFVLALWMMVAFQWTCNSEPDISHYTLHVYYQGNKIELDSVNHADIAPDCETAVDVARDMLVNGAFVVVAHDTEGYSSLDSNQARCDFQDCYDWYLKPRQATGLRLEGGI
jgi:hypothetical protein